MTSEVPTRKHWTRFAPEEQAAVVAYARASSIKEAARAYNMPYTTAWEWCSPNGRTVKPGESLVQTMQVELADKWDTAAHLATDQVIERVKAGKMQDADLVRTAAIATDKRELLRGNPTNITSTLSADEKRARLREVFLAAIAEESVDVESLKVMESDARDECLPAIEGECSEA